MAKKSMIQREIKRTKLVKKYKLKRLNLRIQLKKESSFLENFAIQTKLQKLPRNSAKNRLRNRCWKTGRSRSFFRDFGLSRHVLREMANAGFLPGIAKSSW